MHYLVRHSITTNRLFLCLYPLIVLLAGNPSINIIVIAIIDIIDHNWLYLRLSSIKSFHFSDTFVFFLWKFTASSDWPFGYFKSYCVSCHSGSSRTQKDTFLQRRRLLLSHQRTGTEKGALRHAVDALELASNWVTGISSSSSWSSTELYFLAASTTTTFPNDTYFSLIQCSI